MVVIPAGTEEEAAEVTPAQSEVVDTANTWFPRNLSSITEKEKLRKERKMAKTPTEFLVHSFRRAPVMDRIRRRTQILPSGCWIYTGSIQKFGHGRIGTGNKELLVHRVAYENLVGPIPDGMDILHKCIGTPACWNPEHLYPGSNDDNIRDKIIQGRHVPCPGSKNGNSKLTEEVVAKIKSIPLSISSRIVSEIHGISSGVVRKIRQGKLWRHVNVN